MKGKYFIDSDTNQLYDSLSDVKNHIQKMTDRDKKSYNGMYVFRVNDSYFFRIISVVSHKVRFKKH